MDVLHVPGQPYGCDWDQFCTATFATRDELDNHDREHWAVEDALNTQLREGLDWRDRGALNR
jgi:hypothetical protein